MKKLKKNRIIFAAVCFLLAAFAALSVLNPDGSLTAAIDQSVQNRKIYSNATLEDNFCDNSIIVVMAANDSSFRGLSKQQGSLFEGNGVKQITDLTALPEHYVNTDGSINANNAPGLAKHFAKVAFKQILHIELEQKSKQNVLNTIKKLEKLSGIMYAGPNFIETGTATTNDPKLSDQWGLIAENGIKAKEAWDITTGSNTIRVGVIDSGIADHDDLAANVVAGWDFYNNNAVTNDDIGGHGTKVAGIIGAVGNNGIGVSGVAQNVTLVPLQTAADTSDNGYSTPETRIAAIIHARDLWDTNERISILNHSVGGFGNLVEIAAAVEQFPGLFVWAAGNGNTNTDDFADIDAFNLPNLISVGAIDRNEVRANSSNYGENSVNIYAPSGTQATTTVNNSYIWFSETSAATPHVSGVAALLLSFDPNLTNVTLPAGTDTTVEIGAKLKKVILDNADTITNFNTPAGNQTVKRLNAHKAVSSLAFQTNGAGVITGRNFNPGNELTIPSAINGTTITSIGANVFQGCTNLVEVVIPGTVTSIGSAAFSGCTKLATVHVQRPSSAGVTAISSNSFTSCPVKTICVPDLASCDLGGYINAANWSNFLSMYFTIKGIVTLDRQDGTGGSVSVTAYYDRAMPTATAPTRVGYIFGGYYSENFIYYNSNMTSARFYDFVGDTTLIAKWTPNVYTVTLNTNGAPVLNSKQITFGSSYALPVPEKTGKSFAGWFSQPNGLGEQYTGPSGIGIDPWSTASNITLYAKWVDLGWFEVSCDINLNACTVGTQCIAQFISGYSSMNFRLNGSIMLRYADEKVFYDFIVNFSGTHGFIQTSSGLNFGWEFWVEYTNNNYYIYCKKSAQEVNDVNVSQVLFENIILEQNAVFSISYLDGGGGAFSGAHAQGYPTIHTYTSTTILGEATKAGYTFAGWYADSACSGPRLFSLSSIGYTSNITLYAKWSTTGWQQVYSGCIEYAAPNYPETLSFGVNSNLQIASNSVFRIRSESGENLVIACTAKFGSDIIYYVGSSMLLLDANLNSGGCILNIKVEYNTTTHIINLIFDWEELHYLNPGETNHWIDFLSEVVIEVII